MRLERYNTFLWFLLFFSIVSGMCVLFHAITEEPVPLSATLGTVPGAVLLAWTFVDTLRGGT